MEEIDEEWKKAWKPERNTTTGTFHNTGDERPAVGCHDEWIFWMDESSGQLPQSISAEAVGRFVDMARRVNGNPVDIDPSDIETVLDRYGLLCEDGTVTIAGMLLFSDRSRRTNRGAFMKIDEFDEDGVLRILCHLLGGSLLAGVLLHKLAHHFAVRVGILYHRVSALPDDAALHKLVEVFGSLRCVDHQVLIE